MRTYSVIVRTAVHITVRADSFAEASEKALELISDDEHGRDFDWSCDELDIRLLSDIRED